VSWPACSDGVPGRVGTVGLGRPRGGCGRGSRRMGNGGSGSRGADAGAGGGQI
jgi:hypothetical protein